MKKLLSIVLFLHVTTIAFTQDQFKKNTIYLEVGGNGLFGSINYERQFTKEPGFGASVGIGFYTEDAFYLTIPVGLNYLFKLKNNTSFIDAGLGTTWARVNAKIFGDAPAFSKGHFANFIPSVGYRKQASKNLMSRFSLTPVINNYGFVPWAGISFGKSF